MFLCGIQAGSWDGSLVHKEASSFLAWIPLILSSRPLPTAHLSLPSSARILSPGPRFFHPPAVLLAPHGHTLARRDAPTLPTASHVPLHGTSLRLEERAGRLLPLPRWFQGPVPRLLLVPLETLNRTEFSDRFTSVGVEESKPRQTCAAPMSKKNNLKTRKNAHEFHLQREKELEQKRAAKRERKQSAAENKVRAGMDELSRSERRSRRWRAKVASGRAGTDSFALSRSPDVRVIRRWRWMGARRKPRRKERESSSGKTWCSVGSK